MNEVGFNQQFSNLRLKYNVLKEQSANLIEM